MKRLLAVVLFIFFALGMFLPEKWWGTHYLAFIPSGIGYGILVLSAWLIFSPKTVTISNKTLSFFFSEEGKLKPIILVAGAVILALLFYNFPIVFDDYGDAFQYRDRAFEKLTELPATFYDDLFSLNPLPSAGRRTVLLLYGFISYAGDLSYGDVFTIMGVICGIGYVFAWLLFIRSYVADKKWQIALGLFGLFAPLTQVFYGHIETYALVFLAFTSWLLGLLIYHKNGNNKLLWGLLIGLFICVKLHPLCILLFPAWILTFIQHRLKDKANLQKLLTWKGVAQALLLPAFVLGMILYFWVFKDAHDLRDLSEDRAIDHLFLPLFSPEAPLNRYNLLSPNHFMDYLNILLTWSAPALFIVLSSFFFFRKKINWNDPLIVILGSTTILFAGVLFMINPLVSMPMDWDLFSFPAPLLLLLAVVLVRQLQTIEGSSKLISPAVGFLLLASPFFFVNSSEKMLAERLQNVGTHVFKTYYLHSNRIIVNSANLHKDADEYIRRKKIVLEELKEYAIPGKDPLYASLLADNGMFYISTRQDFTEALNWIKKAEYYDPESEAIQNLFEMTKNTISGVPVVVPEGNKFVELEKEGLVFLRQTGEFAKARDFFEEALNEYPDSAVLHLYTMEANFMLKDFTKAYEHSLQLIEHKIPNEKRGYLIAIQCSFEANMFTEMEELCATYLTLFPDDERIREMHRRLVEKDKLDELRKLFGTP